MGGGGLKMAACSWLALVAGVGDYVLVGVEIGVLTCIFLYFCGCQGGVCVYLYTRLHTHNLLGHLM